VTDCHWLPDYVLQAPRYHMKWPLAMLWGEALIRNSAPQITADETDEELVKEIIDIGAWVQQWAQDGFGIRRTNADQPDLRVPDSHSEVPMDPRMCFDCGRRYSLLVKSCPHCESQNTHFVDPETRTKTDGFGDGM